MAYGVNAPHYRGWQFPVLSNPVVCWGATATGSVLSKGLSEDLKGLSNTVYRVFEWSEIGRFGKGYEKFEELEGATTRDKLEAAGEVVLGALILIKVLFKDMKVGHRTLKAHAPSLLTLAHSKTLSRAIMCGKIGSYVLVTRKEFENATKGSCSDEEFKKSNKRCYSNLAQKVCFTVLLTTSNFGVPKGINKKLVDGIAVFGAGFFGCVNIGCRKKGA